MLNIYKNEAVADASVTQANVRTKELDYFMNNYWTWASTSTVFAGFVFDQLNNKTPEDINVLLELVYLIFTTVCLCCNLCVITWAAFMCIWGPGLALRGIDGMDSFHDTITFLNSQQYTVYITFQVGVISFFLSSVTNVWVFPSRRGVNICCTVLFAIFLLGIVIFQQLLSRRLKGGHIAQKSASGRIQVFDRLNRVGDLDNISTSYYDKTRNERSRVRAAASSTNYMSGAFNY